MPTMLPALKGSFGDNDYYMLCMKAGELVRMATLGPEMPKWSEMKIEEIWQREINITRVKNTIAPYLADNPDRFFGAIIMAVENLRGSPFKPVSEVAKIGMDDDAYAITAEPMGFLTLTGNEILYAIDGQHRIKAFQLAIGGVDPKTKAKLPDSEINPDIANDDVVVILIPYDVKRVRKIFTKVNRYAKATTTGQNLVVDDDDIIAITAREVANEVISAELVNYNSNTLRAKSPQFTTLGIIGKCNQAILESYSPEPIVRTKPVGGTNERRYREEVLKVWRFLVENIDLFRDALEDKAGKVGNDKRIEIRKDYILGKPATQLCLVKAFIQLTATGEKRNPLTRKQAADNLNKIDWSRKNVAWNGLLLGGASGTILTKNVAIAARVIAYMAGEHLGEEKMEKLTDEYLALFSPEDQKGKKLPKRVV